jgi:hypothetical protein
VWKLIKESSPSLWRTINEETPMKTATFASCVALTLLLAAPWLGAQSSGQLSPKMTVDVPFDFMVGHAMFPAGHYIVKSAGNQTFHLQATHGLASLKFATGPIRTSSPAGGTRLIFLEENRHYQLRELWMNSATGAMIPGPKVAQLRTVREVRVEVPASCTNCN